MIFHLLTIFPDFFRGPFDYGVVERAVRTGLIEIKIHDLRQWTHDAHRSVDDRPFGGGEGMVMKPQPIFDAVEEILPGRKPGDAQRWVILMSAQGARFDQALARRLAGSSLEPASGSESQPADDESAAGPEDVAAVAENASGRPPEPAVSPSPPAKELLLICGRYEGVDERVAEYLADEELSVGDYVLSGGELAAAIVVDAVARLREGVLGNRDSAVYESFGEDGILDCPQYTRPEEFRGWKVPPVLVGGHHAEIRKWRRQAAEAKTARQRPDLVKF